MTIIPAKKKTSIVPDSKGDTFKKALTVKQSGVKTLATKIDQPPKAANASAKRQSCTNHLLLSFKKNLNKILARNGIPALHYGRQKWVSERYSVSTSGARKWLKGECLPDWEHITLIADDNNVSIDELLGRKPFTSSGKSLTIPVKGESSSDNFGVIGDVTFEEGLIKTAMRMQHNGVELHVVSTDCMAPSINEGDIAFVDTEITKLKDNRIYLLSVNGRVLYRRVMYQMDGSVILSCENANYPSQIVKAKDILTDDHGTEKSPIKVVGEVVWIIKRISSQSVPVITIDSAEE